MADQGIGRIAQALLVRLGRPGRAPGHRRRGIEILDLGIGAELGVKLEMRIVAHQHRDIALRVFEIAELDRLRDAGGRARRRRFRIDARRQAAREPGVDAVLAEGAFLRHAQTLFVLHRLLLLGLAAVIPELVVGDGARLIRAGDRAVCAADANVVVLHHQAVGALRGGACRTHRHAGRFGAMLAAGDEEQTLHVRECAGLDVNDAAPLYAGQRVVGMLAGDGAGLATDAAVDVDHHSPARGVGVSGARDGFGHHAAACRWRSLAL